MSDSHPLDGIHESAFDWAGCTGEAILGAARSAFAEGYAVRLSPVGYGAAMRVTYGLVNGDTAGWTVTSGAELERLLSGLQAPGWQEHVKRRLTPPSGRSRRR